jgi:hypothetical protein
MAADKPRWTEPPLGGGTAAGMGSVRFSELFVPCLCVALRPAEATAALATAWGVDSRSVAAGADDRRHGTGLSRGRAPPADAVPSAEWMRATGTRCA